MGTSGQGPCGGWGVRVLVDKGYVEDGGLWVLVDRGHGEDGECWYQWIGAL